MVDHGQWTRDMGGNLGYPVPRWHDGVSERSGCWGVITAGIRRGPHAWKLILPRSGLMPHLPVLVPGSPVQVEVKMVKAALLHWGMPVLGSRATVTIGALGRDVAIVLCATKPI